MDYINYSYVSLANILCYRYISLKLESWNNSRKIQVTWKPSLWPTFISWLPISILGDPCQRQIVGARESLNGRENMARRKEKNGEKSPWGQCVTRPVPNCRGRSGFWLVPENVCVFHAQSEGRTAATVWNWSGKTLFPGALLAVLFFSSCHISPPV